MSVLIFICLAVVASDKDSPKAKAPPGQSPAAATGQTQAKSDKAKKAVGNAKADSAGEKPAASSGAEAASVDAVKQSAQRFAADYNKRDAKAAAAAFTPQGEFITMTGARFQGREEIEDHFAMVFAAAPKAHLELKVEVVHLVTSNVALEEGEVELTTAPGLPIQSSRYVALHVYKDGRWLLERARDFAADEAARSNHERLLELEWLVGEWIEEEEDAFIATSCRWSDDQNYLMQDFTIRIGGLPQVTGSTRIGWDPLTRQIKSWTFDSDGGYSEALWTHGKDQWVLKTRGVTHLGRNYSKTSILRHVNQSTLSWESRDAIEGGVVVPNTRPLLVKRRPPPPGD
jgi:uncharacterized protein (TIGR02246 family)